MSLTAPAPTTGTTTDGTAAPFRATPAVRRRRRALGIVATLVVALAVWLVGHLAGADYRITDSQGSVRIDALVTTQVTVVLGLVGWGVLALLERVTRHGTAIWTVLAALVVAASMIPVFLVEATTATRIALVAVHLAVGALIPFFVRARS
ncbi:DUF6069 family protein [Actinomycetospora straminea]|uniref:Uncharacterized protein n=1 Tax=Actinomycetospora straminea TaxID=663607 RepID=A0ABP9DYC7_9PSEU|nr:DUF6069 family protein [Actinomycetospora straminea]MDD7932451.1 DUF6069 family protein [Actinomycetospora straminea]